MKADPATFTAAAMSACRIGGVYTWRRGIGRVAFPPPLPPSLHVGTALSRPATAACPQGAAAAPTPSSLAGVVLLMMSLLEAVVQHGEGGLRPLPLRAGIVLGGSSGIGLRAYRSRSTRLLHGCVFGPTGSAIPRDAWLHASGGLQEVWTRLSAVLRAMTRNKVGVCTLASNELVPVP